MRSAEPDYQRIYAEKWAKWYAEGETEADVSPEDNKISCDTEAHNLVDLCREGYRLSGSAVWAEAYGNTRWSENDQKPPYLMALNDGYFALGRSLPTLDEEAAAIVEAVALQEGRARWTDEETVKVYAREIAARHEVESATATAEADAMLRSEGKSARYRELYLSRFDSELVEKLPRCYAECYLMCVDDEGRDGGYAEDFASGFADDFVQNWNGSWFYTKAEGLNFLRLQHRARAAAKEIARRPEWVELKFPSNRYESAFLNLANELRFDTGMERNLTELEAAALARTLDSPANRQVVCNGMGGVHLW